MNNKGDAHHCLFVPIRGRPPGLNVCSSFRRPADWETKPSPTKGLPFWTKCQMAISSASVCDLLTDAWCEYTSASTRTLAVPSPSVGEPQKPMIWHHQIGNHGKRHTCYGYSKHSFECFIVLRLLEQFQPRNSSVENVKTKTGMANWRASEHLPSLATRHRTSRNELCPLLYPPNH